MLTKTHARETEVRRSKEVDDPRLFNPMVRWSEEIWAPTLAASIAWVEFLSRRTAADFEVLAQLRTCSSAEQAGPIILRFWNDAAEAYQTEFLELSFLLTRSAFKSAAVLFSAAAPAHGLRGKKAES